VEANLRDQIRELKKENEQIRELRKENSALLEEIKEFKEFDVLLTSSLQDDLITPESSQQQPNQDVSQTEDELKSPELMSQND
jgi:superfamily II RNA helicase